MENTSKSSGAAQEHLENSGVNVNQSNNKGGRYINTMSVSSIDKNAGPIIKAKEVINYITYTLEKGNAVPGQTQVASSLTVVRKLDPPPYHNHNMNPVGEVTPTPMPGKPVGERTVTHVPVPGGSVRGRTLTPNNAALLFVAEESDIEHSGKLQITDCVHPEHFWILKTLPEEPRFKKVREMRMVWWLEIKATIQLANLSPKTKYAAYLIFRIASKSKNINKTQEAVVIMNNQLIESKMVCVAPPISKDHEDVVDGEIRFPEEQLTFDGWRQLELGQFYYDGSDGGEDVVVKLEDLENTYFRKGLIVAAIEVRPL